MKFGARMFKTGLSASLAFLVCTWLGLTPPLYAAIAATLTIQPSIFRSWKYFLEQLQANLIGAFIGISFTTLFGHSPIFIGIAIIIVIGINLQLKFYKAIEVSIVTVIVIMESTSENYLLFAGNRFLIILIGILSSLLINALFIPPKYEQKALEKITENHKHFSLLLRFRLDREFVERKFQEEEKKAHELLEETKELFRLYQEEKRYVWKGKFRTARKIQLFRQMIECNQQTYTLLTIMDKLNPLQLEIDSPYSRFLDQQVEQLLHIHEKILLRYAGVFRPKVDELEITVLNQKLIHYLQHELPSLPQEVQPITVSIVGELINYADELRQLDKLVTDTIKHEKKKAPTT